MDVLMGVMYCGKMLGLECISKEKGCESDINNFVSFV